MLSILPFWVFITIFFYCVCVLLVRAPDNTCDICEFAISAGNVNLVQVAVGFESDKVAVGFESNRRSHAACEDTPFWRNGASKRLLGCEDYVAYKWCLDGHTMDYSVVGEIFNYPEDNCVACGKCNSQKDDPLVADPALWSAPIQNNADLQARLQYACDLELATVPLYLTAVYSARQGSIPYAVDTIKAIALEEMVHLNIVANLLYAVGGRPLFRVPSYPGGLPAAIFGKTEVHLEKLSKKQLKVFMGIEQPSALSRSSGRLDIGDFYKRIRKYIHENGNALFMPNISQRSDDRHGAKQISNVVSALEGIDLIIAQGEGSELSPIDLDGMISHYYRFAELYIAAKLAWDGERVGFTGDRLPLDEEADVYPLIRNASREMYNNSCSNQRIRELNDLFNFISLICCGALRWPLTILRAKRRSVLASCRSLQGWESS